MTRGTTVQQTARPAQPARGYDAIVVGSGITGGWAAKELCEKGLKVLVLERGPHVEHGRYPNEFKQPWEFEHRGRGDRQLYESEYPIQSLCYAFGEATRHFFVNDREHPSEGGVCDPNELRNVDRTPQMSQVSLATRGSSTPYSIRKEA